MSKPEQVYVNYIKTTPEKLWAAITNPEFARQYWGGKINVSDWKKGSTWEHQDATDGNAVRIKGKVLESNPPKKLVLSWISPKDEADISTVTFEIEGMLDMVKLTVMHGDFKKDAGMPEAVGKGWPLVLSSLKSFLETGQPINILALKTCSEAA